ncbi:MAG: FAD-binding oxidoreductase, partial [Microcoleaceae cyanobacterium MO_207.B10]|nr:FAD-binding oxidoreductase [Microcoleaceae cyanobacterium MO_207.B10]
MIPQENVSKVEELETIVGKDNMNLWDNIESKKTQQISQTIAANTNINCIVYPQTEAQLAAVISWTGKNQWVILPCGNSSKLHWGGLVKLDPSSQKQGIIVVSCDRLNRLIEHAEGDLTVTVEAGMKYAQLQEILGKTGQFLPIDPTYPETATIG